MTDSVVASLDELRNFAERFLASYPRGGAFGLTGDLGAGKTTFVRTCIEVLTQRANVAMPRVTSPSFVIHQSYSHLTPPIEHFDLYRLDRADVDALAELGYEETRQRALDNRGYCFVEWPERASDPGVLQLTGTLNFLLLSDGKRRIQSR